MKSTRRLACLLALLAAFAAVPAAPARAQALSPMVKEGRDLLQADKIDDALDLLRKAVEKDPQDPFALAWLGTALCRKAGTVDIFEGPKWVVEGYKNLDEAVTRFPDAYIGYVARGIVSTRVPDVFKKLPSAVTDLSTVVAMHDKDPKKTPDAVMGMVYLNLGTAYKKSGQPDKARETWETGKKLYPKAPELAAIDKELKEL
jgi:Tfp pilus assembly protein PilF